MKTNYKNKMQTSYDQKDYAMFFCPNCKAKFEGQNTMMYCPYCKHDDICIVIEDKR